MTQPATEPSTEQPSGQEPPKTDPPAAQPGAAKPWGDGQYDEGKAATLIENLRREKSELQEKARKFDEAERAKLSEIDRERSTAAEHKTAAEKAMRENAQLRAVIKYGLTEAQAARLRGDTADEILADGEAFAKELGLDPKPGAETPAGGEDPAPEKPEKDITSHRRPSQQPEAPAPRGGRTPSAEPEEDLRKIIDEIPR